MTDPAVIIGAGPAGLAVAATLRQLAVPFVVLERSDSVGAAWHDRYDSLHLHTIRWLSGLPGVSIPRRFGRWVARDDLIEYLAAYADRFGIRPDFGAEATRVERDASGWRVHTTSGIWSGSAVVVATGYTRTPYLPNWPGRDSFTGTLMHSADYREPSPYLGTQVLVVGAGNSAAEIALELADVGCQVDLSVRTPPNIVRRDTLGVPSQLIGIALKRAPERVMNPMSAVLRRFTVPDLAEFGLPSPPGDGFTSSCAPGPCRFSITASFPLCGRGGFASCRRSSGSTELRCIFAGARPSVRMPSSLPPGSGPTSSRWSGTSGCWTSAACLAPVGCKPFRTPRLHFVGIDVTLSGLLRDIGLDARAVGQALAAQRSAA